MDVEVEADAARVLERLDLRDKSTVLRCVTSSLALISLGAGVGTSTVCKLPLKGPVAVNVSSDTATAANGLAVLAPEAVICLGVDKAIGVDDGHDVEVELVDDGLDARVRGVFGEQLPGHVLGAHGCNPLTGVNCSVDEHCRLRPLATRAPDMDTSEDAALDRRA